ncbi:MAG: Urease accessory protein UreF [Chroococcidiopsis cubana SAG 39.79]|uniref:urease accessory protein UreF n=1 Tax=Chroococcidiopsis cubana TaxID=171392 RepID=UPI000D07F54F|nr:urease accessory protein UreF [Chroococcidiopsis cubana]MDZ4878569.1 Urease accessory protein UreF [Chroococcidiopsis cubana SAG 39.79]PSB65997.1 urease accessory protein UreF [Chroococcidiopsis cubana CCALA 043]
MDTIRNSELALLSLLQLASPALPVGAYSYSEGIETLVEWGAIADAQSLQHWLERELHFGAIRIEAAMTIRAYNAVLASNLTNLNYWNSWLSAARETEELRNSSWQMGRSLMRLLLELEPQLESIFNAVGISVNYAIAFGVAAHCWQISQETAVLGYLHSWATNLITAGIKLIPLGQTAGQQILINLQAHIVDAAARISVLTDDELSSCSWGLSLASMAHETQYTRLFRS